MCFAFNPAVRLLTSSIWHYNRPDASYQVVRRSERSICSRYCPRELPAQRRQDRPGRYLLRPPFHVRRIWQPGRIPCPRPHLRRTCSRRSGCHLPPQLLGIRHHLSRSHARRRHPHAAQSLLPRTRDPLSTGKLRRSFPHHRRSAARRRESCGTSHTAPHLHHAQLHLEQRRLRESAAAGVRQNVRQIPGSSPELARNRRRPALLQRHHRTAQGRHALALQPGCECLSDPRPECRHAHAR